MNQLFEYIDLNKFQKSKRDGIVDGILDAIANKAIAQGDPIPSVNKFIQKLGVARMTVVKALNILKERGIIVSEDKVGYFVKDVNVQRELKVFLFLTGFYSYHEILYNSIIEGVTDPNITIDIYFHHCNPKIFRSVLRENIGSYGLYVITSFDDPEVRKMLAQIPERKLLQIIRPPLNTAISSITQDFTSGLKKSLEEIKGRLLIYETFILLFPEKKGHPEDIKTSFTEFCNSIGIKHRIERKISRDVISKNCAYWVIEDSDLISLIKISEDSGFQIGTDIGILSYNETPMKEIIRNGITVISADFVKMGQSISSFINTQTPTNQLFKPEIIFRKSL